MEINRTNPGQLASGEFDLCSVVSILFVLSEPVLN